MPEHVHGCLTCRPDLVPDFDRADPRYHGYPKCHGSDWGTVLLDGEPIAYTSGVFEGPDGWVLFAGLPGNDVHTCPCDGGGACVEPRFGHVGMRHGCPSLLIARLERATDALKALAPDRWVDLIYGGEG